MKYFSEKFLQGLATKSEEFQDEWISAIKHVDAYINNEEEIKKFHEYLDSELTYVYSGNIIMPVCIEYLLGEFESFAEQIMTDVMWEFDDLFDDEDDENTKRKVIRKVTHLIVCVRSREGEFSHDDMNALLFYLRMLTGKNEPKWTIVQDTVREGYPRGVYILGLK